MENETPIICLDRYEWISALSTAIQIGVMNHYAGAEDKDGLPSNRRWDTTIEGFCGEAAFAKYLNVWWAGNVGNFNAIDVAGKYQIKTTKTDDLIIRDRDINRNGNDCIYICLKGKAPEYRIMGWIHGDHVMLFPVTDKYNNNRPARFIHYMYLQPISLLLGRTQK
jgi:hypothetical protein